jgi:hypothetical protein
VDVIRCSPRSVVVAIVFLWAVALHGATPRPETTGPALTTVTVSLSTVSALSETARRTMITEAERIWRAEGVQLLWIDSTQPSAVRIVVLHGPRPIRSAPYALASFDKSRAEIVAMLNATQQVIQEWLRTGENGPTIRLEHALGLALGRVIAHEIGHHLLGNEHAPRGLMRAVFDARTLVDPRASANFALDERSRARLRERLRPELKSPVVATD